MTDKINILGTEYKISYSKYGEDIFVDYAGDRIAGYCNGCLKLIAICDMSTFPGWEKETIETCKLFELQTLRHEIVHAFLNESGLCSNSLTPEGGWARNEEMVDWIATQGEKIYKAWEDAGALVKTL